MFCRCIILWDLWNHVNRIFRLCSIANCSRGMVDCIINMMIKFCSRIPLCTFCLPCWQWDCLLYNILMDLWDIVNMVLWLNSVLNCNRGIEEYVHIS